jgi:dGTP triphosphohydrolase
MIAHSLEVAQIGRSVRSHCESTNADRSDLPAHDLGHLGMPARTRQRMHARVAAEHNLQSLRVVDE